MAKKLKFRYIFNPSADTVEIYGRVPRERLLLITNVTDNIVIYNFADSGLNASSVTYSAATDRTSVVLQYDCSAMSSGDDLQIFIEDDAVEFEPSPTFTDPVSKFRVSQSETLIDTDFEYGLQPTKWETLELVNNIPGFYSKSGDSSITVSTVTGTNGSTSIVINSPSHGLSVGTPIDIRGLSQANLDGSYLIASVPDADTISITAKNASLVSGSLLTPYTTIIPGRFYAGSQINYANIVSNAADPSEIRITTEHPSGFVVGSEFYLVNTVGTENISFDSSGIDIENFDNNVQLFNPHEPYGDGVFQGNRLRLDPWEYVGFAFTTGDGAGSALIRAGGGGQVGSNLIGVAGTVNPFSTNDCVAVINGPDSVLPTGLTDRRRYFVVGAAGTTFGLAVTVGGAATSITAASGSGIFMVIRGYGIVGINSTTDVVTLNEVRENSVTTSTPLMLLNTGAGGTTGGTATGTASGFSTTSERILWDSSVSTNLYYFGQDVVGVGSTSTVRTGTAGGGNLINFSSTTIPGNGPILVPLKENPTKNTISITNHGFFTEDPVTGAASTVGYRVVSLASTFAVSTLTGAGATYFIDPIDTNTFGLKDSSSGSRKDFIRYNAISANTDQTNEHRISQNPNNTTANTLYIPGHGLNAGDLVTYEVGSGTSIGGLSDGLSYFVLSSTEDTTNRIKLSTTLNGSTIDLTTVGSGIHTLTQSTTGATDGAYEVDSVINNTSFTLLNSSQISPTIITFDPSVAVGLTDNTIDLSSHRYITGTPIEYGTGGGTAIGGLVGLTTYYAIRISKDRIGIATQLTNALSGIRTDLSSVGTGTEHTFTSYSLVGESTGIGSVSISEGSLRVVGEDTAFLNQFKPGDPFVVNLGISSVFETTVASVGSNQVLAVTDQSPVTNSGLSYLIKSGLYVKSEAYSLHRPFDGGVEINPGKVADTQIIRQTRRYFRYQSGKGINAQFAINFNPPVDVETIIATGTTATVTTRYPHGISTSTSANALIRDAEVSNGETNYYNGTFAITSVPSPTSFTYTMNGTPTTTSAKGFPQLVVRDWGGCRIKAGMFDDQNGLFWEYDGTTLRAVRRNSIQQLSGRISVTNKSNVVTGTNTRFSDQLSTNDKIVIRGQTYKVVNIGGNTTLYIQPAYRGEDLSGGIASKTVDDKVTQANFSIDPCDGTGKFGYDLDITRIQMVYIDYSWYGAGKARFGFKGANGEVIYVHEFIHNNNLNEAYFRSGNLPARYEIENVGSPAFAPSLAHWGSTVAMDGSFQSDQAYLFTASSSLLTFSGSTEVVDGNAVGAGTSIVYRYVNASGSESTGITTSTIRVFNGSDGTFVVSATNNTLTISNHGYSSGQLIQYTNGGGGTIGGLTNEAFYYVGKIDANRFYLYDTEANALAGGVTGRIDITSVGTGSSHQIRSAFRFTVTTTTISGYGERIIHRFRSNDGEWDTVDTLSFGTPIQSAKIISRVGVNTNPGALLYRVSRIGNSQSADVDFFFVDEPSSSTYPAYPSLGTIGFIGAGTTCGVAHTLGEDTPPPSLIPLISIRLSPSVDGGLTGPVGSKEIINRMQLSLQSVGLLTTHDVEIRLILNAQLDNVNWAGQGAPSLSQLVAHQNNDTIDSGVKVFSFRASGGSEVTSGGRRSSNTFSQDISSVLSLGNSILGGDSAFPDGPDVLTLAVVPLNPTQITLSSPFSVSGRITWSESQA